MYFVPIIYALFVRKPRTTEVDKCQVSKSILTMPNKAQSHTENRAKVCLLCFQKGSDMVPARGGSILARIRKYFVKNYDSNEEHLPSAICSR